MKTITVLVLFAAAATFTPATSAKNPGCSILKQSIEAKLKGHGVQQYTLDVVDIGAATSGKEVGRCDDGTRKIIYSKGEKSPNTESPSPRGNSIKAPHVEAAKESLRAPENEDRLRRVKTRDLIESLHLTRNAGMDYSWPAMPANIRELGRRPGDVTALVRACRDKKNEAPFHFNLLAILNHKMNTNYESRPLDDEEKMAISNCLVDSLKHESAMVRTEAVWGLAFFRDPRHEAVVSPLLQDSDANVVREAKTTMDIIQKEKRKK